jgi:hypothetical protein
LGDAHNQIVAVRIHPRKMAEKGSAYSAGA